MQAVSIAGTSHGTVLSVDMLDHRLCHTAPGCLSDRLVPVQLFTGGPLGARCLPFAFDAAAGRAILPRPMSIGSGIILYTQLEGTAGPLRAAASSRYLSAIPDGRIEADRAHASAWEMFNLAPATAVDHPSVGQLLSRARQAFDQTVRWLDSVIGLLGGPPSEAAAALLEAAWVLLTLDEFDHLAEQVLQDRALERRIRDLFPGDFYAVTALPALTHWRLAKHSRYPLTTGARLTATDAAGGGQSMWRWRETQPSGTTLSPLSARTRPAVIGPELDHLARDGYDGRLSSFAHACNASLRARVAPAKGVAIVATARSEGVYLLEWIAHHRILGVEAIFLYTNNNDDGSDVLLAALHDAGVITWTRSELGAGVSAQNKAYGHALNVSLPLLDHRWALFIDLDEFLVLNPVRYRNVAEFARWHEMRQTDAVGINWVMVGSSGQTVWSDTPLTRRNTHLLNEPNAHLKVMLAPRRFIQAHPHFPFADRRRGYTFRLASGELHEYRKQPPGSYHARAFSDEPSCADACLYHYNFKSVEEFAWKSARNRGDFPLSHEMNFVNLDQSSVGLFMLQHRSTDVTENDRLSRCAPGLEQEMARLRSLPGVADAERAVIAHFRQRLAVLKAKLLSDPRMGQFGSAGEEMRALLHTTVQ